MDLLGLHDNTQCECTRAMTHSVSIVIIIIVIILVVMVTRVLLQYPVSGMC